MFKLLHSFLPTGQQIFVDRIDGQLGLKFIVLAAFELVLNSWIALESKRCDKQLIYLALSIITIAGLSVEVIYAVSTSLIEPFG